MTLSDTDALAELQHQFIIQLPARLETIRTLCQHLDLASWQLTDAQELHRLVHNLTGAAGAFGMLSLSDAAHALENRLNAVLTTGTPPNKTEWGNICGDIQSMVYLTHVLLTSSAPTLESPLPMMPDRNQTPLIHLVEDDPDQAAQQCQVLQDAGYRVSVFTEPAAFRTALAASNAERPAAVIMDMVFPEGKDTGITLIHELGLGKSTDTPVIVVSVRDDLAARLAALRAGACRYLVKPINSEQLINQLDILTLRQPPQPYRALMVDDDPMLLEAQAAILQSAGIEVRTLSQPLQMLEVLTDFTPDVVVLDVYMPGATGLELAAVLRDSDEHLNLPILFLSAETDITQQLLALNLGGDDFLVKPAQPEHLIAAVTARARRARQSSAIHKHLQATLYEREREHMALNYHAIVSIADRAGNIIYINGKFCEVSGYTPEELFGQNHRILKSHVHPPAFYQDLWQTISHGDVWQGEICNRRKDGSLYWVESTITPFLDNTGQPYQYVSIRTDITEAKEAEGRLSRSQIYANIGTWDWNIKTGDLYWSERIPPLFGYPEGKLETSYENFLAAVHPDDRQSVIDAVAACVEKSENYDLEHRCVWPDGTVRWLLERGDVVRDANGLPLRMLGVVQDITNTKSNELALAKSRIHLEEAQSLAKLGNWSWDLASGTLSWSDEIFHIFGLEPRSIAPTYELFFSFVHPDDVAAVKASELHAQQPGGRHSIDHRITLPDGEVRWVHEEASGSFDASGNLLGVNGTVQDIHERKLSEQALRNSEARWAFAVEGAGDGVWDWNIPTGEMLLSRLYEAMLGYAEGELEQTVDAWLKTVHPDDLPQVQANLQDYLTGRLSSYVIELRLRCKDGSYKWILCRGTVVERDGTGQPIRMIGIHSDINERKLAELQLALYREMIENTGQAIFLLDIEDGYRLSYVNQAAIKHWGASREELLSWHLHDWDPDFDLEQFADQFDKTVGGPGTLIETEHRLKDGCIVPVEIYSNARIIGGKRYTFGSFQDISARKKSEAALHTAKEAAEHANQAKSDFLASMSHELRTPMNAILGFAQLMEGDATCTPDQRENLQQISKAGWHLLDLINEVLDLARIESGELNLTFEDIDITTTLSACLALISPLISQKQIVIQNHIDSPQPKIRADYLRLKQVLINLLSNAIKYNDDGGMVSINATEPGNDTLVISVRDTGRGMSTDQLARLFEPFTRFGNTETVHGTGIGLSICKKLVERMNGEIQVSSTLNVGSDFSLILPLSSVTLTQTAVKTGGLSLLYIEDDPAHQSLLGKWATQQGWAMAFAHDAATGIDAAMSATYDAILLDIDLPGGFSGLDVKSVLDEMESLRNIPVIAISNLIQQQDIERAMQMGFVAYLTKPVDLPELKRTIRSAIRKGNTI